MMVPTLQGFYAQSSSEKETPCLYIPNVMSIRCDDYNKDYTLKISATAPCNIEKLEVYAMGKYCIFHPKPTMGVVWRKRTYGGLHG